MKSNQGTNGKKDEGKKAAHCQFPKARRINGFYIVPSQHPEVGIVGYDPGFPGDQGHPLYEPRVDRASPAFVREDSPEFMRLVAVYREFGNTQPAKMRRNGERFEVTEGRQRWRAFRDVINPAHVAAGEEEQAAFVVVERAEGGDERWFARRNLSANACVPEDPITIAIKVQRAQLNGASDEDIHTDTGLALATIERYGRLLECSSDIQMAVRAGLSVEAALTIGHRPLEEQPELLSAARDGGHLASAARVKEIVRQRTDPEAAPMVRRPPTRFVRRLMDTEPGSGNRRAAARLDSFLLGLRYGRGMTRRGDVGPLRDLMELLGVELPR